MQFELCLLGTNSALPAHGRHPSAQVLKVANQVFLIDCGEGTQMQMLKYGIRNSRIRQIFISHLHGDHVFGLIGLLTSYALNGREQPLDLYAPAGLEEMIEVQLRLSGGGLPYELNYYEIDTQRSLVLFENKILEVRSLPLRHRVPTSGFLFTEKPRPRNIRPEKIEAYNIHYSLIPGIKGGADLELPGGRIIPNAELTVDPPPVRSFAYCSDTAYCEAIIPLIRQVDLLYHESTFCEDNKEQTDGSMHSTAKEAAQIARRAGAKRLILGHYSSRYKELDCFLDEARRIFPDTVLGLEGKRFEV